MNRIDDYTSGELLALTEEEIAQLIDVESAFRGVALLPPCPTPPEEVRVGPDVTIFAAGGEEFMKEEDAQKVCDLINSLPRTTSYCIEGRYSYSGPRGVKHDPDAAPLTPQKRVYWTEAYYDKHRSVLAAYREAKATYDRDQKEFERIRGERDEIAAEIYRIRSEENERRSVREEIQRKFDRYVELANGDRGQALKFYLHAADQDEDLIRDVVGMPTIQEKKTDN